MSRRVTYDEIRFRPDEYGTANPSWTKQRAKTLDDLDRLARHICRRTPSTTPIRNDFDVFSFVWHRNRAVTRGWTYGEEWLVARVYALLCARNLCER